MLKILLLTLLLGTLVSAQDMDFIGEDITFRLDTVSFSVEGHYWFANRSDRNLRGHILYPLPASADGLVDSFYVANITKGRMVSYRKMGKSGISFYAEMAPFDTLLFRISYKQKTGRDSVTYILRSTQQWGKALEFARYKLITPLTFKVKNFSYPPEKTWEIDGIKIYSWEKIYFMPDRDIIFYY